MNEHYQTVTEIHGQPGRQVGNLVVPLKGRSSMQVHGDILRVNLTLSQDLESSENLIRLSKIDSIAIEQGRIWWLLWLGIPLLLVWFLGIIFIVLFFILKQRWIAVYSGKMSHFIFFKDAQLAQIRSFAHTLLAKAEQGDAPRTARKTDRPKPPIPARAQP